MRVLLAAYRDDARDGGSLRVGETLALGLRRLGVEAELCFAYGAVGPVGRRGDIPCHYLGLRGSTDVGRWRGIRALLRACRPTVVHFLQPLLWMQLATLDWPLVRVIHVHGMINKARLSRLDRLAWRLLLRRADRIVCITNGSREALISQGLAPRNRTAVVYNGVDFERFQSRPSTSDARRQLGVPPSAKVVGMVCRLFEARGCDDLIRLLPHLDSDWYALLAGDGPERTNLLRLAKTHGVEDRVIFAGALEDVRPALSAMDAFAFLALYDSFGLSTAEAMACRVPVFGLGGPGEYREPNNPLVTPENAIFIERRGRRLFAESEDQEVLVSLADRLNAYGRDPSIVAGMVSRAWSHVRERFSMDSQASAMRGIYEQVRSPGAAAPGRIA